MARSQGRLSLTLLASLLAAGAASAQEPAERREARAARFAEAAAARLMEARADMGLDEGHAFQIRRYSLDDLGQTHTRMQKTFEGLKVWGGDLIVHTGPEGEALGITATHKDRVRVGTTPSIGESEALAVAHRHLNPKGPYTHQPSVELVVFPETAEIRHPGRFRKDEMELNAEDMVRTVTRHVLAYHVHAELENGDLETVHRDYLINAHTGRIIRTWDSLHTAGTNGTGRSQYSGNVSLSVNSTASGYEMSDVVRSMPFKTYNLNHATSGTGTIYTDADNTWGDGANYVEGSSTTADNGQTAGVDAHYGTQVSFDYYKNVLGRNGIDGAGRAAYNRVHYSNNYDNAFWSDSCFCMTYGDGSSFTTLTSLDVAAHEMTHGVCANEANLTYSGESGGLNESNSDIFGAVIEVYARNGNTIPASIANTNACWKIGEQLNSTPLRYMDKPSKDGSSKDAWYSGLGSIDVHYSSGPNNRMFFFLSQGSGTTSGADNYSSYLPGGMTGIGMDKAAKIWYRALANYLTSSSNYAAARTASISAAKDLYGAGGPEEQAVWNAYAAINVGSPWGGTPPPPPPPASTFPEAEPNDSIAGADVVARTYTAIQGGLTAATDKDYFALSLNPGETLAIAMTGPSGVDWDLKLFNAAGTQLGVSQGSSATENLSYTNSGATAVTVYPNVYVYSGTSSTPYNLGLTYSGGSAPDTQAPTCSASESGTSGTITFSATASDNVGVSKVEFYVDGVLRGTDTSSPYSMTFDSTALSNGTHTLVAKAYDAAGNVGTSTSVSFSVSNTTTTTYNEVESNGSTGAANVVGSTITKIVAYIGSSTDQDFFKITVPAGRTLTVNMTGPAKDYDLYLLSSSGSTLKSSLGSTATESVSYANTGTTTATYYIKVIGYAGAYSTTSAYNLALTR
jgi:Zn-dependent metalloprotease